MRLCQGALYTLRMCVRAQHRVPGSDFENVPICMPAPESREQTLGVRSVSAAIADRMHVTLRDAFLDCKKTAAKTPDTGSH